MKKAIITLSLICAGLLATSNIGDTVFAQDTTKNINKTNNVEVQVINKLNNYLKIEGKNVKINFSSLYYLATTSKTIGFKFDKDLEKIRLEK